MKITKQDGYQVIESRQVDIWISFGWFGLSYDSTYCDGSHYLLRLLFIELCWRR